MAISDSTTEARQLVNALGVAMVLPQDKVNDVTIILRVILALSIEDAAVNEAPLNYDDALKQLEFYRLNIDSIAKRIREVTGYVEH